jgi:biopolymer transport protein ExbD
VPFDRGRRQRRGPSLTPLIDVVFLLLVFFMLASRFERESFLPLSVSVRSDAAGTALASEPLRVEVDEIGRTRIDGRQVDQAALAEEVSRAVRAGRELVIRPAAAAPLQPVVDVLATSRRAGALGVGLERVAETTRVD